MMKRAVLLSLLLAGCTNTLNFKPTMASDPPLLGLEGIALANELAKAYVRLDESSETRKPGIGEAEGKISKSPASPTTKTSICSLLKLGYQEQRSEPVARYAPKAGSIEDFHCVGFKPAQRLEVKSHVQAGLALSDYFCSNFFERIAEHAGKRKFARNTTNDVGALVSTVLALAAAGVRITGGAGAFFGLADSAWRNYDDNFLVSTDLPTVQRLVLSEQKKFREALKSEMPDNYSDATNVILRYANLCSFVGMRGLLIKSMEGQTRENDTEPADLVRQKATEFVQAYEKAEQKREEEKKKREGNKVEEPVPVDQVTPAPATEPQLGR